MERAHAQAPRPSGHAGKPRVAAGGSATGAVAAEILRLQRTAGNRAVISLTSPASSSAARPLLTVSRVVATRDLGSNLQPNPLAHVEKREKAQSYIQALALGDLKPLKKLDVKPPKNFNPQSREWGLGWDKDVKKFLIVFAGEGEVAWNRLPSVVPLAHSHPLDPAFVSGSAAPYEPNIPADVPFPKGIKVLELLNELAGIEDSLVAWSVAATKLLPSNQDLQANFLSGSRERLYTPYRFNPQTGALSVTTSHPAIAIDFGPTHATLAPEWEEHPVEGVADSALYKSFIAKIDVVLADERRATLTPIWSGYLTCGWEDLGGGLAHQPPRALSDARSRSQNAIRVTARLAEAKAKAKAP